MIKTVVFFGTRETANRWANKNGRSYRDVFLGTQTEKLQGLNHVPDVVIDDNWEASEEDKGKALLSLDVLELLKIMYAGELAA